MDFIKKYKSLIVGMVVSVFLVGGLVTPTPVKAQTVAELQAMIQALMQQIAVLIAQQEGGNDNGGQCQLVRNMGVNESGWGVSFLQKFLNRSGYVVTTSGSGSPGQEGTNFDENTRVALARYQAANGINPANGYLGPITRANINSQLTLADCGVDDNENGSPHFRKIENIQTTYKAGESISLEAEAVEVDRTTIADASKGFNVRAYIFKGYDSHNESYLTPNPAGSHNARFNPQTLKWDINMEAPETSGEYSLRVILERYGNHRTTRYFYFKVIEGDEEDQNVSIDADLISATAEASGLDGSGPGDMSLGMFRIKYRVTAIGGDVFIGLNCALDDSRTSANYSVVASNVVMGGSPCSLNSIPVTNNSRNMVTIKEGKSKEFDLRASSRAESGAGNVYLRLNSIKWSNSSDEDAVFQDYKDPSSLRTAPLFLRSYDGEVEENMDVTVTTPNGGEEWEEDSIQTIRWQSENLPSSAKISISLFRADGANTQIVSGLSATAESYRWTVSTDGNWGLGSRSLFEKIAGALGVPVANAAAPAYKIQVGVNDGSGVNYRHVSDSSDNYFLIVPQEESEIDITVTSPGDNSHVYKPGDMMNIAYSWNGFSYTPRFNIDLYSMDNKVATIATDTTGGRYSWTIPSNLITSNHFRVNVYSLGSGVNGWSGRFTINASGPTTAPAIRGVNIDNYQTPWTNRTTKTIRWNYSNLPQTGLKFKVGLYTNLNGGMWGNSVFVNAVGTSGAAVTSLDPRIGESYFNKDYFIMVRLYNADGTEFRPQGKRIETVGTQIFQVVPPTTGMVNKEDQLASIYNTLENMLEGLLK